MKFVAIAVAALFGVASAKKRSLTRKDLQRRLQKGQFHKETLMAAAKPYGRKLDQEEEEFAITGDYSIQFDHCLSLTIQDENLFGDDFVAYAEAGKLISEKSYVTFNVCQTEYCYYQGEDDKTTFIVDVNTFVMALANYLPQQQEKYCEGCKENEDYCMGNYGEEEEEAADEDADGEDGEEGEDQDGEQDEGEEGDENDQEGEEGDEQDQDGEEENENGNEDDRRRKLSKKTTKRRKLQNQQMFYEQIDCDKCEEYLCFQDDEEDQNENGDDAEPDMEDVVQWIENVAQCGQIEDAVWVDGATALYAGFICNGDGSGVEVGVFLDEDCTEYTLTSTYANAIANDAFELSTASKSAELVQYMFTNDLSCDNTETVYYNPYDGYEVEEDDGQQDDNEDEQRAEANEWCQNLMDGDDNDGDFQALSLADCEAEEQEEDENDAGDDYVNNYAWYSYDLKNEDAENPEAVCAIVRGLNGEYTHVYSGDSSGSLYDYTKQSAEKGGLSGGAIAAIIIAVLIVVGVGAAYALGGSNKKDSKKKPLISGSMA